VREHKLLQQQPIRQQHPDLKQRLPYERRFWTWEREIARARNSSGQEAEQVKTFPVRAEISLGNLWISRPPIISSPIELLSQVHVLFQEQGVEARLPKN
jgi:hypothetical protein